MKKQYRMITINGFEIRDGDLYYWQFEVEGGSEVREYFTSPVLYRNEKDMQTSLENVINEVSAVVRKLIKTAGKVEKEINIKIIKGGKNGI